MEFDNMNLLAIKCVVKKEKPINNVEYRIFVNINLYTKEVIYKVCSYNRCSDDGNWNIFDSEDINECIKFIENKIEQYHSDAIDVYWIDCNEDDV